MDPLETGIVRTDFDATFVMNYSFPAKTVASKSPAPSLTKVQLPRVSVAESTWSKNYANR
jgi:hypothetical protein